MSANFSRVLPGDFHAGGQQYLISCGYFGFIFPKIGKIVVLAEGAFDPAHAPARAVQMSARGPSYFVPAVRREDCEAPEGRKSAYRNCGTLAGSERVAIGKRIEEQLVGRKGSNQYRRKELVQNFAQAEPGEKTRNVAAEKAGFGNAG